MRRLPFCPAVVALSIAAGLSAAAKPFDELVPEHTTVFLTVPSPAALGRQIEACPLGEAWKGPEMEAFTKRLGAACQALLADAGKELGYSLSDYLSAGEGEMAVVLGDPASIDFSAKRPEVPAALLIDVAERKDKAKEFLDRNLALLVEKQEMRRTEAEFRGHRIILLEQAEAGDGDLKAVAFTLADDLLAVSLSRPFLEGILANRAETSVKPLKDHPDYRKLKAAYAKDAGVFLYAHLGRWLDELPRILKATEGDKGAKQAETAGKVLDLLGVTQMRALCWSLAVSPGGISQTAFLHAPGGAPKGLLKMLWTKPSALRFPALVPEDVNSATVAQIDFGAAWTMIEEGAKMAAAAMAGPAQGDGPAPDYLALFEQQVGLSLKNDFFGPLGGQVVVYDRLRKPYTENSQEGVGLIELKDREKFQSTLDTLLGMTPLFRKREYLGRVIYTFSLGMGAAAEEDGGDEEEDADKAPGGLVLPQPALCVTDSHLLIAANRRLAEETIRRIGKEVKSVNDAPAFQAVAGRFPASSILLSYQSAEFVDYLFSLAKTFAKEGAGAEGDGDGMDADEEEDAAGPGDTGRRFEKALKEAFARLPEPAVFTRHLAGLVAWGFVEADGIGMKSELVFKK